MTPKITIAFVTCRPAPQFRWFCDSLCAQTTAEQRENLEVVFIDGHAWLPDIHMVTGPEIQFDAYCVGSDRALQVMDAVAGRFRFLHLPPKPCAWQGPFRQTKRDFFCAGNTRNTAFIVADHPYVVFVDDLSVLMPGWFNQVLHAAQDGYVVAGAYKKVKNLQVHPNLYGRDGWISYEPFEAGVDSRWPRGSDGGVVPWHGSALFGCSFGVPLEAALEVDGNDAACNGQGAEDTDFGMRLERAGYAIFYNRNMLTLESEELHHDGSKLPQERKAVTADRLPRGYGSYVVPNVAEAHMSDHVVLNRLCNETSRITPLMGENLRAARAHYQATGLVAIPREPQLDWRDGAPLKDL